MKILTIGSGSSGNCYLIRSRGDAILLEAGVQFKKVQQALKFKTRQIKALFITHEHLDHAKYVKDFLNNGIEVYMTPGTKKALEIEHYRLHTIEYQEVVKIGAFTMMPFEAQHDVEEPCSYIIKSDDSKLLFATDSYYIKYKIPGLTHIMLEVNHDYDYMMENVKNGKIHGALANRIMKSHLNIENAIKYLNSIDLSKLQEITLIHLSKDNSKENEFKDKIQRVTGVPVHVAKSL